MPEKRRTPVILWRIFRERARSLANTIISLLPPPSSAAECRLCDGRRCLFCSGAQAISFLLRRSDPSDYQTLLNSCFVVVSETAPPHPHFLSHNNWSQHQVRTYIYLCINVRIYVSMIVYHLYNLYIFAVLR